jgi:hypothetical protein
MEILYRSLAIAVTLSLLILCSGCATQYATATIPAGPSVAHASGINTIPAGPSVVPSGTKHFAEVP